jgi:hypothetical protein
MKNNKKSVLWAIQPHEISFIRLLSERISWSEFSYSKETPQLLCVIYPNKDIRWGGINFDRHPKKGI